MKRKTKLIPWLVVGIILALCPVWGKIGTVVGMLLAFDHLGHAEPDVELLAKDISLALYTTATGFFACPIGITITIISAIKLGKANEEPEGIPNQSMIASTRGGSRHHDAGRWDRGEKQDNDFAAVGAANEGCPTWFCVLPAAMVNAKALGFESPPLLTQVVGGNAAACQPCRFRPPPADCDP